jgi:hypothetical protein
MRLISPTIPTEADGVNSRVIELTAEVLELHNIIRVLKHKAHEAAKLPKGHVPIADYDYVQKIATEMSDVLERHGLMGDERFYCSNCKSRVPVIPVANVESPFSYCMRCMGTDVIAISKLDPVHLRACADGLHEQIRAFGDEMSVVIAKMTEVESKLRQYDILVKRLRRVLFNRVWPRLNKFKIAHGLFFVRVPKSRIMTRPTRSIGL